MADKQIKVKVETEVDIQPTIAELKKLKLQLKETSDPAEFKKLQQQINDTEDAIKAARTGADNFAEVLGTLPGPIGSIGNAVGGTVQTLKQFGALKFSDIKASFTELGKDVVDAGKGLLQLTGITKAYEVVTASTSKALQFFGVSLNTANTAGKALGVTLSTLLAASGILAIVAAVDILTTAWDNFSKKAERAEEAQKKLNETLLKGSKVALDAESASVKRSGDLLLAQAKARGANADEIYKIEQSNRKLLLASQQRYYNDLKNKDSDEAIAAVNNIKNTQNEIKVAEANFQADKLQKSKQAADKNAQQNKTETEKEIADKKKALEDIAKNEKAAALSLLDEREQQKRKIVNDYNDQIKLAAANGADTVILEEAKLNALRILNDKFKKEDEDALKSKEDFAQYEKQLQIATIKDATDRAIAERQSKYDKDLSDLEKDKEFIKKSETEKNEIRKNLLIASENDINKIKVEAQLKQAGIEKGENDAAYARLAAGAQYDLELQRTLLEQKKTADDEYYASQLSNENLTAEQIRELNDRKLADQIFYTEKSNEIERSRVAVKQKALDDIISIVGAESDIGRAALIAKQILAAKELILEVTRTITFSAQAAARSTVAVAEGVAQTAKVGFPQNIPLLIGYAAQAVGIIMAIKSAVNSAKASATGNGSNMPSISAPAAPTYGGAPTIAAPQIQTTGGMNPTTQLSQTITGAQRPIKAYVVSGEISSQQALDRRTSRAATFSAG